MSSDPILGFSDKDDINIQKQAMDELLSLTKQLIKEETDLIIKEFTEDPEPNFFKWGEKLFGDKMAVYNMLFSAKLKER